MVTQLIISVLLLLIIPMALGGMFCYIERGGMNLLFRWVSGQICLWGGFQLICVPMILFPRQYGFRTVVQMFWVYTAAMLVMALGSMIRRRAGDELIPVTKNENAYDRGTVFFWIVVHCLLVLQLFLAAFLAYEEGDDAFYVATSTITNSSDTMYQVLPYTGGETGLDARHGLAPFPIWVAFVARMTGLHAATVAQIVLPIVLICMAYAVFFVIGRRLFGPHGRKLPIFMLLLEVMVIFGGQSLYTAENFLLVRTAQGKAVLADIVIPFIFLMIFILLEKLQAGEKIPRVFWVLLVFAFLAGCLCSTQGALLTCLLLGVGGACAVVSYRKWRLVLPIGICCLIPISFALLYLFVD